MLTVKEVSKKLNVSTRTIYRYIKDGKIQVIKLNHIIRIEEDALSKFIDDRRLK